MRALLIIFSLLLALPVESQTRFYLSATTASAVNPSFSGIWNSTSDGIRRKLIITTKDGTTLTSKTSSSTTGTGNYLMYQFVSDQLQAVTIASGATIKGQMRANASSTSGSPRLSTTVKVYRVDASGTYIEDIPTAANGSGDYTTTLTNRYLFAAAAGTTTTSAVTLNNGDRIVVEIGFNQHFATQARTATMRVGGSAASDLSADETSTTDNNPWIEFSTTFAVYTPTAKTRRVRIIN